MIQPRFKIYNLTIVVGILFSAAVGLLDVSINKVALYIVLPFIFCISFMSQKSLLTNKYMNILLLLFVWILLSVLWATSLPHAIIQVNQILGSFILCYIFSVHGKKEKVLVWLYVSFLILLLGDWHYAYHNMLSVIDLGVDRLDDQKLNANTFAYHTFYATFSSFILGELNISWRRIMRIIFLLMIPLSFFTAIFTASRQVLIIQIPLILILVYCRYFKSQSVKTKFITLLIVIISFIVYFPKAMTIYSDSKLKERNEINLREDGRTLLLKDAIMIGNQHFPLGVGANNFVVYSYNKGFSHNTYLELYVNEGIVGVALYVYLMLLFLRTQWRRFKRSKDLMYFYFFVAGFFFAVDGLFYVFYPHLWSIGFFILVATHSDAYYKYKQINSCNI